ncbi:hypothetical protein ACJZ2D_016243 [Fusarium nematophilum]
MSNRDARLECAVDTTVPLESEPQRLPWRVASRSSVCDYKLVHVGVKQMALQLSGFVLGQIVNLRANATRGPIPALPTATANGNNDARQEPPANQVVRGDRGQRQDGCRSDRSGRELVLVTNPERRTFENAQDRVPGVGHGNRAQGGPQLNVVARMPHGSSGIHATVAANNFASLGEAVQRMANSVGCSHVSVTIEPTFDRYNTQLRRRPDVIERAGPHPMPALADRVRRPAAVTETEAGRPLCANCDSMSHTLDYCVRAPNGSIHGCPICNIATHLLERCPRFGQVTLETVIQYLVWDRGCMPAWETETPWYDYLCRFVQTPEFRAVDRQIFDESYLPWTEEFATQMATDERIENLQLEVESGNYENLPPDPSTLNPEAAFRTFALPCRHIWPENPADLPQGQPGRHDVPVTLAAADAAVASSIEARRACMVAVFRHLGGYTEERWEKLKATAVECCCREIYKRGVKKVSVAFFELNADRGLWYAWSNFPSGAGTPVPQWPWEVYKPDPTDFTDGVSQVYAEWVEKRESNTVATGKED